MLFKTKLHLHYNGIEIGINNLDDLFNCKRNEYIAINKKNKLEKRVFSFRFQKFLHQILNKKRINTALNDLFDEFACKSDKLNFDYANKREKFYSLFHNKEICKELFCFIANIEIKEINPENCKINAFVVSKLIDESSIIQIPKRQNRLSEEEQTLINEFKKIKQFRLSSNQIKKTKQKLDNISCAVNNKKTIKENEKLNFDDLRTIHGASYLTGSRNFRDLNLENNRDCSEDLKSIVEISRLCSSKDIRRALGQFTQGFQTGDVVFYDLKIKQMIGDNPAPLQLLYERYSHVGIISKPKQNKLEVMHRIAKIELTSFTDVPVRMAFLNKKSLDFDKIFDGYKRLSSQDKRRIRKYYQKKIAQSVKNRKKYAALKPVDDYGKKWFNMFFRPRKQVEKPQIWDLESQNEDVIANKAKSAEKVANQVLCSGFTAGVVFEALQGAMDEWNLENKHQTLAFNKAILLEVTEMTPKDIKKWNIWKKDEKPQNQILEQMMAKEVLDERNKFF